MKEITVEEAKAICAKKHLAPARVKNETRIQFTDGDNPRDSLMIITWDEFEATLKDRNLRIYEEKGFMRIMAPGKEK